MITKICKTCSIKKPLSEFRVHCDCKYGVAARCKVCVKKKDEVYRLNNRQKVRESQRAYAKRNKNKLINNPNLVLNSKQCCTCKEIKPSDEFHSHLEHRDGLSATCINCKREYDIEYRHTNKYEIQQRQREYRNKNAEKLKEYRRQYYIDNKDKITSRTKHWHAKPHNKTRRNKYLRSYNKKRWKTCPATRIRSLLSNRVYCSLKRYKKSRSTMELVGCSPEIAKWFLEQQFYPNPETGENMIWENHGYSGWHMDHIIPISSFDLSNPDEQARAFHVSNVQSLWAKENLSKGSKTSTKNT